MIKDYLDSDDFFKKVYDSQVEFAKLVYPYHSRVQKLQGAVVTGAEKARKAAQ